MLAYIQTTGPQAAGPLGQLAERLAARGFSVAGVTEHRIPHETGGKDHMELALLGQEPRRIRISQDLGAGASGCRLDPDGLARAVGLVGQALNDGAQVLILNTFGKQEADGSGFRDIIGQALTRGIPVVLAVSTGASTRFEAFAQGCAERLPAKPDAIAYWLEQQLQAKEP